MNSIPQGSLKNPVHFLALGFGAGMAPKAPGTFGNLVAIPFIFILSFAPQIVYVSILMVTILAGVWICEKTASDWGVHDHSAIVWDEIAGIMLVMAWVPITPLSLLLGFLLFRLFDIVKPYPISWLDRHVKGGLGIMVDDLMAGLYAVLLLKLILHFI